MLSNSIELNDGNLIPQLGFGLWQIPDEETESAVCHAIRTGYRLIDSAQIYGNERGLGLAIKSSEVPRKDLYITTKIWNSNQGHDGTLRSFDESLKKLGTEYLDLLLIHWPAPRNNLYVETWKALIELKLSGRVRSIGVSNFNPDHLERIIEETAVIPAVNQIEVHPKFQRRDLRKCHERYNIRTESWSPLGQGQILKDPVIGRISEKHGKSPAQIILRWHLDQGLIAIPKTVTLSRMEENFRVFGFKLDKEDHELISGLDQVTGRIGPDPMTATF